jgi:hypothetical protein
MFANSSCEVGIPRRLASPHHDFLCTRLPEVTMGASVA